MTSSRPVVLVWIVGLIALCSCSDDPSNSAAWGNVDSGSASDSNPADSGVAPDSNAPDSSVVPDSNPEDSGSIPGQPFGADHSGEGTYYAATGAGNCSFPESPNDLLVAAMNNADYGNSEVCGMCVRLTGPQGTVDVRIVDRCPECKVGDLDLSPEAFGKIAEMSAGRVPISWRSIPCPVTGPIVYHFKDGANPWWFAAQVRNHRYPIAKFEVESKASWVNVERVNYNFFVMNGGFGEGPYHIRVTDIRGQSVEDNGIPLLDNADAPGVSQFPP